MTKETYCSLKLAKLLDERGFDGDDCHMFYATNGTLRPTTEILLTPDENIACLAPTHQMAMKWLMDEHNIYISVYFGYAWSGSATDGHSVVRFEPAIAIKRDERYMGNDFRLDGHYFQEDIFLSYDEAIEAAILYSLEKLMPTQNT